MLLCDFPFRPTVAFVISNFNSQQNTILIFKVLFLKSKKKQLFIFGDFNERLSTFMKAPPKKKTEEKTSFIQKEYECYHEIRSL